MANNRIKIIEAFSATDLETAVNTYLTASTDVINEVNFYNTQDQTEPNTRYYQAIIEYTIP